MTNLNKMGTVDATAIRCSGDAIIGGAVTLGGATTFNGATTFSTQVTMGLNLTVLGVAPLTTTSAGVPGTIMVQSSSSFLFVCIASNSWARVALSATTGFN